MGSFSEGENSKLNHIKRTEIEEIEIDPATVDFTGLDEYIPKNDEGGGCRVNIGSKKREDWESDERLLDYIGLLAYTYPKKEVAKKMGIAFNTLREWEKESEAIRRALNTKKEDICKELEGTLRYRAKGYEYEEVKTTVLGDVRRGSTVVDNQQTVKIEKVKKHQPPDVGALIFMLTNLSPEEWKNRQRVDGSLNTNFGEAVQIINDIPKDTG